MVKVLFSAMALCFARLSLTLSFVVARKGKGAALFRTTRVIIPSLILILIEDTV